MVPKHEYTIFCYVSLRLALALSLCLSLSLSLFFSLPLSLSLLFLSLSRSLSLPLSLLSLSRSSLTPSLSSLSLSLALSLCSLSLSLYATKAWPNALRCALQHLEHSWRAQVSWGSIVGDCLEFITSFEAHSISKRPRTLNKVTIVAPRLPMQTSNDCVS